jgi:hypothetical protein
MIQISLKALTKLLLNNGHKFTIERLEHENFKDRNIFQFIVSQRYPSTGPHMSFGKGPEDEEDREILNRVRREKTDGRVVCQYDADKDVICSICVDFRIIISNAIRDAVNKQWEKAS